MHHIFQFHYNIAVRDCNCSSDGTLYLFLMHFLYSLGPILIDIERFCSSVAASKIGL